MSKKNTPRHCRYSDFAFAIHPDFRPTEPQMRRRSRNGKFPKYWTGDSQKNPALYDRVSVVNHYDEKLGDLFPGMIEDLEVALGVKSTKGKGNKA